MVLHGWRLALILQVPFIMVFADDTCLASSQEDVSHGSQLLQLKRQSHAATPHLEPEPGPFLRSIIAPLSNGSSCLKFMHIPKNAGTTTEWAVRDRAGVHWGPENSSAFTECSRHVSGWECLIHDSAGNAGLCPTWHVPPVYDPVVAASYEGCTTFCIKRHPLERAVSQYHFSQKKDSPFVKAPFSGNLSGKGCGTDDPALFAKFIDGISDSLSKAPFAEDCHWVPQSVYIGQGKYCQRVLRYENLKEEFNALMAEYKLPMTIDGALANPSPCRDLSEHLERIPEKTIQKIETMFAADYRELGYARYPEGKKDLPAAPPA